MVEDGWEYSKARLEEYRAGGSGPANDGTRWSSGDYDALPEANAAVVSKRANSDEEGDGDEDELLVE